jgi:ATP-dependent DNA helicase RecG
MRPEILFPLFTSVSTLKGVGPRVAPLVEKLAGPVGATCCSPRRPA